MPKSHRNWTFTVLFKQYFFSSLFRSNVFVSMCMCFSLPFGNISSIVQTFEMSFFLSLFPGSFAYAYNVEWVTSNDDISKKKNKAYLKTKGKKMIQFEGRLAKNGCICIGICGLDAVFLTLKLSQMPNKEKPHQSQFWLCVCVCVLILRMGNESTKIGK